MPVKSPAESSSPKPARRGVIAVCVRDGRLLVIERSQHVEAPGAFCFPGGAIEPDEAEPVALVRELREELNATITPRRPLWQSTTDWGVELRWWLAELNNPDELIANPQEVAGYQWLSPAALAELPGLLSSNSAFLAALESGSFTLEGD